MLTFKHDVKETKQVPLFKQSNKMSSRLKDVEHFLLLALYGTSGSVSSESKHNYLNDDTSGQQSLALRHTGNLFSVDFCHGLLTMKTMIKQSEIISQDPSG